MLAFTSGRGGPFNVFWMALDEDSPPESLVRSDRELEAVAWSRDGKKLIVLEGINDLKILSVENPGELLDLQSIPGVAELKASFSPSGRWVTFTSNEEGRWEIYARDLSRQVRSIKISDGGGHSPLWSPDGKEIFYHSGDSVMVVAVEIDAEELKRQRPLKLFSGRFVVDPRLHATFDYDAAGDRFLLIKTGDDEVSSTHVNIVFNWLEEIEGLFADADAGKQ